MRFITIVAAWILGWIVYMIAMIVTVYDGLLSLIFQPIMAGLTSTAFVGAALLGFTAVYTNPETGSQFRGLHPMAALGAYFLLIFSIANWPPAVQKQAHRA